MFLPQAKSGRKYIKRKRNHWNYGKKKNIYTAIPKTTKKQMTSAVNEDKEMYVFKYGCFR